MRTSWEWVWPFIDQALKNQREELTNEVIGIATLAFGKKHRNYGEFVKALTLSKL
jgi:hypothetical protein